LAERWRRPIVPLEISQSREAIVTADGRILRVPVLTLSEEDKERIRLGYACAKCLRPFERAWPERCPDCGAPVRREQAAYFAREYDRDPVRLGPSTTLAHERATLAERIAKEKEAKHGHNTSQRD